MTKPAYGKSRVDVAGAGAFGTALAVALAQSDVPVCLWARDAGHVRRMQRDRANARRLPEVPFPDTLSVTASLETLEASILLLAVPAQQLAGFLASHAGDLRHTHVVACSKGIDLTSGQGPTSLLSRALPEATTAILTGPSFAADIARGLPTALTLACRNPEEGALLQQSLATPVLRLYRSTDTAGAELGGALKNVVAIAAGLAIGAGLGESARAALMTRGYAEMQRFACQRGARAETLAGLSGFGDLVLTCTSAQSRNFAFGLALGGGGPSATSRTVEGVATAGAVARIAREEKIDMPITQMVNAVISGDIGVPEAMQRLLARPLKEE